MKFEVESWLPPVQAFARVADFGDLAEWDPFVRSVELTAGGRFTEGAVYEMKSPAGLKLSYELVELDFHHETGGRVKYIGGTKRGRSTDTITVVEHGSGSAVTISSELTFAGWARAVGPLIRAGVYLGGRFVSLPAMRRHLNPRAPGSTKY